jgi:hypothetical protein
MAGELEDQSHGCAHDVETTESNQSFAGNAGDAFLE